MRLPDLRPQSPSSASKTRQVQAWIERASAGDQEAVGSLCQNFEAPLARFVDRQMGRRARRWSDPLDVVQVVLSSVLCELPRRKESIDEEGLRRRLCAVARWRVCDLARHHQGELGDSHVGHNGGAERPLEQASMGPVTLCDRAHWIHRLIDELDAESRDVVRLRGLDGLEFAEIGSRLGLEPDTARMRFRRAVGALRDKVKGRELEAG